MKTQLQLNQNQIIELSNALQVVYTVNLCKKTMELKAAYSLGMKLADKFDKKRRSLLKKANLLNQNDVHNITLDYHEAWAIHTILIESLFWTDAPENVTLRVISDKLNQKLT